MSRPSIDVGDRMPDFELPDEKGQLVRSEDLLGRGPVVIYFYPKDETAGCTAQACSFRDANEDFARAGARIVGISSDDVESHRKFSAAHKLGFTLLADRGGRVRKAFGVERSMMGLVDGRVTFVIDKGGVVRHRYDSLMRATKHVDEALGIVKDLAERV
jgi:peroxiredoxin Q/BCP